MTEKVKFYLYEKTTQNGPVWYARFLNEATGKYDVTRSTGVSVKGRNGSKGTAHDKAAAMLATVRVTASETARRLFTDYVADFWTAQSPYVKAAALVKQRPLSALYIKTNHEDVRRHLSPFPGFSKVTVKELTPGHIHDWQTWAAERGMSGRRIGLLVGMSKNNAYKWAQEASKKGTGPCG